MEFKDPEYFARTHGLVGNSAAMRTVMEQIVAAGYSDGPGYTVNIIGASGTGKELVAKAIHKESGRSGKRFYGLNCAELPETLLEDALFGHVKGSFTGAVASAPGILKNVDGGTLFLDEILDMSPNMQAKLLRVIQEREYRPVGGYGSDPEQFDVRLITASSRSLDEAVRNGDFRDDLRMRLSTYPIHLSSLTNRGNDVILIADYLCRRFSKQDQRARYVLDDSAKQALMDYAWPGNVRELEQAIHRAITDRAVSLKRPEINSGSGEQLPELPLSGEDFDFLQYLAQSGSKNSEGLYSSDVVEALDTTLPKDTEAEELSTALFLVSLIRYDGNISRASAAISRSVRWGRMRLAQLTEKGIVIPEDYLFIINFSDGKKKEISRLWREKD